ncbi:TonB-dependent receptor [Methylobacillus gramineus]|uniref:TonB-dependent receptor n=1 Tax=Methylobacillus gramineus TaxID=755169 RepID=UPI001D0019BD|nr:TonB-dependent receptor [Methylobacillus gramineus]MCB5185490.1 TonB-dependent receptor [Methylobacillus gramineus]
MSNNSKLGHLHKKPVAKLLSRLGASSAPAFVVAGIAMGGLSHYAHAAENDPKSVESLQEENAKLSRELNELKQRYNITAAETSTQATPVAAIPAAITEQEQTARDNAAALGVVVVTSRNREEIAQDVPIPISVIGGPRLDRERIFTVDDITRVTPGLTATTPNARRSGISIRGIGKSTGDESMEAAVGAIVDDVYLSLPGMTYQDFTDLDRVEVLRGPQGTLKGKNTTLGAINYVTKEPTFTRQTYLETEVGANQNGSDFPGALRARGSISDALIDNVIAYRTSFFIDRQEGDIENINNSREGGITDQRFHERNRFGGKIQFLITPTENFKAKISLDYAESKENSNTKPFQYDPVNFANGNPRYRPNTNTPANHTYGSRLARDYFGGYSPIIGSKDKIDIGQAEPLLTKNYGISAKLDWNIGSHTLTSITAYRGYNFDATNDQEQTRFDIAQSGTLVDHKQYSQEIRWTSDIGELYDYQVGLFYLHTETSQTNRASYGSDAGAFFATDVQYNALIANRGLLQQSLNGVRLNTRFTPETDSFAAFGQVNWHLTEKATLTTGLRKTYEYKNNSAQRWTTGGDALTDSNAIAIRNAQIGSYAKNTADELNDNSISWLVSPSYKVNDDLMFYASAAGGEKSPAISFNNNNGTVVPLDPEKSVSFELGTKGLFFDRRLMFNANIYHTIVKGYQATTSVADASAPGGTGYRSQLGNIPEITATGIEFEGGYLYSDRLSFTFGGAYNRAQYEDWSTATRPPELGGGVRDNTGKQIVGAPKLTGIIGAHYIQPIWGGLKAQAFFSTVIRSKQNVENLLSEYGEQSGYSVTDAGIGIIGGKKDSWEFNLVGKNIFDKVYTTSVNTYSNSAPVGYDGLGQRRYVGVVLRTKF